MFKFAVNFFFELILLLIEIILRPLHYAHMASHINDCSSHYTSASRVSWSAVASTVDLAARTASLDTVTLSISGTADDHRMMDELEHAGYKSQAVLMISRESEYWCRSGGGGCWIYNSNQGKS